MIKDKPLRKKLPVEKSDGHRVAIVQNLHYADHWKMHYHEYRKELAPTKELKDAFLSGIITWTEYKIRYKKLIASRPEAQKFLREWKKEYFNSKTKHLTLLCYCEDRNKCHRSIVVEMISEID